jgi:hypothetical protein
MGSSYSGRSPFKRNWATISLSRCISGAPSASWPIPVRRPLSQRATINRAAGSLHSRKASIICRSVGEVDIYPRGLCSAAFYPTAGVILRSRTVFLAQRRINKLVDQSLALSWWPISSKFQAKAVGNSTMNLEKFDEIERSFQRSFFFLYNNGGGSLIAAQKMPRCLIAFMNSENSTGFTT